MHPCTLISTLDIVRTQAQVHPQELQLLTYKHKCRLAGACGSCPSSLTTMTMGIKRRLMEKIPEILDVVQVGVCVWVGRDKCRGERNLRVASIYNAFDGIFMCRHIYS
jgi:hypothetical protein